MTIRKILRFVKTILGNRGYAAVTAATAKGPKAPAIRGNRMRPRSRHRDAPHRGRDLVGILQSERRLMENPLIL